MMSDGKKYDVFLSYKSLDHADVERVAKDMKTSTVLRSLVGDTRLTKMSDRRPREK